MQYKLSKDFGRFLKGDILSPDEKRENMYECTSGSRKLFIEHKDVILALPEIFVPIAPKWIEDAREEYCKHTNDVKEDFVNAIEKYALPVRNITVAIDPANGHDEGCAVISEHDGETMTILDIIGLHKCKCQKMFVARDINNWTKDNSNEIPCHDYYIIRKFLKDNDLFLDN